MAKEDKNNRSIDLSGFSDEDIDNLYGQASRGIRRQGYDGSNDVTVDYDPMASDALYASQAVTSDWEGGLWDDVRDKVKANYSDEDLIWRMRGAVSSEYNKRQEAEAADTRKQLQELRDQLDAMNKGDDTETPAPESTEPSKTLSEANSWLDDYNSGSGQSYLDDKKDDVKTVLADENIATRGPNSIASVTSIALGSQIGLTDPATRGPNGQSRGGGPTPEAPLAPSNYTPSVPRDFLRNFKLQFSDNLKPVNRKSFIQDQKDRQAVHRNAQSGFTVSNRLDF